MIWAMIIFACTGHTNARCVPLVTTFESRGACKEAMTIRDAESVRMRSDAICLPLSEAPIIGGEGRE